MCIDGEESKGPATGFVMMSARFSDQQSSTQMRGNFFVPCSALYHDLAQTGPPILTERMDR